MSGLLGALSSAARALEAQQFGLEVAGQNIANVNTPGYTRRTALLSDVPGPSRMAAGRGVEITGLRAARDEFLDRRLRQERPAEQRQQAIAGALAAVETVIGKPGASLDAALNAFFDAAGRLAADPSSAAARQGTVRQADALAQGFRATAAQFDRARRDADLAIRAGLDEVNRLAGSIAHLNAALGTTPPDTSASMHLRDKLENALSSLTSLVDISVIPQASGGADIALGDGRPLVVGATTHPLQVTSAPPLGLALIHAGDGATVSDITGGSIGGLLHVRDVLVPGYQEDLDRLAHTVATEVNAVHRAGFDASGVPGGDLFEVATVEGAAAAIRVSAPVLSDPGRLAAGAAPGAGDNGNARALAALRDARVSAGGTRTLGDEWAALAYSVGADALAAREAAATRGDILRQAERLREQTSGVSLDEEAMMMMKFQRAYEANARFFRAIDQSIDTLIQALGR